MSAEAIELWLCDRMVERLAAVVDANKGHALFGSVTAIVDADAPEGAKALPAALVVPLPDEAQPLVAPEVEASPQRYVTEIAVIHIVAAANDRDGARSRSSLSQVLAASRKALAGWKPPVAGWDATGLREALAWRRGGLFEIDGARLAWADRYEMQRWASSGTIERLPEGG